MNGSTSKAEIGLIIGLLFFIAGMILLMVTLLFLDNSIFGYVLAIVLVVLGLVLIAFGAKLKKDEGQDFEMNLFGSSKKKSEATERDSAAFAAGMAAGAATQYQYSMPQTNSNTTYSEQAYQQPAAPAQPQQPVQPEPQVYQQPVSAQPAPAQPVYSDALYQQPVVPMQPQQAVVPETQPYQQPVAPAQPVSPDHSQLYGTPAGTAQPYVAPVQGLREVEQPVPAPAPAQYGIRDGGDPIMRFCPNCGEKRVDLVRPFCPNCGTKMEWKKS